MHSAKLASEFDCVCRLFFPQWDDHGNWRVCTAKNLRAPNTREGASGVCDCNLKMIQICDCIEGRDRTVALIHETAHAVVRDPEGKHGNRWQAEMRRAAQVARQRHQLDLAEDIEEDAFLKSDDPRPSQDAMVQYETRRRVRERPMATFREISDFLADKHDIKRHQFWQTYRNTIKRASRQERRRERKRRSQEEV